MLAFFLAITLALTPDAEAAETVHLFLKSGAPTLTFNDWTELATVDGISVLCKAGEGCKAKKGKSSAPLNTAVDMATREVKFTFKAGSELAATVFSGMADDVFVLQMNKADLTEQLSAKISAPSPR